MKKAVTLGESMALFRSPEIGRLETKAFMELGFGGAESNVAIGLSRFGIDVNWISRLGDDALGNLVSNGIRGQGVKLFIERDSTLPTGLMVREIIRRGESNVTYYRSNSAASQMQPALVESFNWTGTNLFHTTGITSALSSSAEKTVFRAFQLASEIGAIRSLDINFRRKLTSRATAAENTLKLLPFLDYLFGSEEELLLLSSHETDVMAVANSIAQDFDCTIIIKRADQGPVAVTDSQTLEYRGEIFDPVDSVGAGDAFVAAFLASVLQQKELIQSLEIAHAFGALSVLAPGDWESQPNPADLFSNKKDVDR